MAGFVDVLENPSGPFLAVGGPAHGVLFSADATMPRSYVLTDLKIGRELHRAYVHHLLFGDPKAEPLYKQAVRIAVERGKIQK